MILQIYPPKGREENKILRKTADKVADPPAGRAGIKSAEIKSLIEKMADAMFAEPDGVGIAAPQIGETLQIFLVAKDMVELSGLPAARKAKGYLVFINPVIKKLSQKKEKDIEGCLSLRGVYGEVLRPEKLTIEYFDERGKKHQRGASGLLARVIQHEVDHLNGVLFIDKAKNITRL